MLLLRGLKAWIIAIIILAFLLALFVIVFQLFLLLLPVIILLIIVSYLFRKLNRAKTKTPKKEYIDVKYKVKS